MVTLKKIKILYLIDELQRGGKERQFVELIRGLNKDIFEIHTITFLEVNGDFSEEVKKYSKKYIYYRRKIRWDLSFIFKLNRYIKKNNIDIVHVWDDMSAFFGFWATLFLKAKFVNASIQDTYNSWNLWKLLKMFILKFNKNIISNSKRGLEVYRVKDKGIVIYNGIDPERFKNLEKYKTGKFIIGIVANLTIYKDYYTFFDAINILKNKIDNLEVWVIGDGNLSSEYKKYANEKGISEIIKYYGRVENPEKYICNFNVGVLCSFEKLGEGISNSVLEYMACGVPPIITDVGAAREIIEDGINGFLFEPGNAKDLAEKIYYLYCNPDLSNNIGEKAKKTVEEKFSYAEYIKKNENLYLELIK